MSQADRFKSVFSNPKPIIGMVHLLPLPGTPYFRGSIQEVIDQAVADALALSEGGVDGILIQNRGDLAYGKDKSDPEIISMVTKVVLNIIPQVKIPLGVHLLRNDTVGSIAVSKVCEINFIRVAAGIGLTYLPQGLIEANPSQILRERARLEAEDLLFLTDVESFHYIPLVSVSLEEIVDTLYELRLADAFVVALSDVEAAIQKIERIKSRIPSSTVLIGGFINEKNLSPLIENADGAIIGSAFEQSGRNSPVSKEKVLRILDKVVEIRQKLL